ncbi:Zinc finger protein [Armadillidium nasatum]|uniref:Zinc finger protein n=1 Tax=Armadillidium nasatum TaxID=96803 RepID=A0A5N5SVF0_9CRUS|nr:Zinc finger protein [Armadillidium nasatum]
MENIVKIVPIIQDKKSPERNLSDEGNEESSIDDNVDSTSESNTNVEDSKEKNFRYLIVEHMIEESIGYFSVYKCSLCPFSSNDEETALEHKCIKKIGKNLTSLKYEKHFELLNKRKLKDQENRRNIFQCHRCGAVFKTRKELMTHTEKYLEGGYRCPLCGNRFALKEWINHVRECPGNGTTTKEDHYCDVCDVFFADKRTLCNHKAFHDPCRPFECSECKFRFYTPKNLEDHMQKHTSIRFNKKCPFCDFRSTEQVKIVDHTRCHTGDRPYKCPQCDHFCSTYEGVQRHLTSHTITKDFACDICGKRFNSQNNMASHRKIHKVDKPHRCPICKKAFKFGRLMKLHHKTHLDIREHKCPHCPYKARTAVVLRGHMNTHTNKKPFKCDICEFRANHKSYLTWHMKYYHPA